LEEFRLQREKVRVYALARELNIESKDLLDLCKKAGFDVKNQLSSLEPEQRDVVVDMIKKGTHKQAPAPGPSGKPVTPSLLDVGGKHVPTLAGRAKTKEPETPRTPAAAPPAKTVEAPAAASLPAASLPAEPVAPATVGKVEIHPPLKRTMDELPNKLAAAGSSSKGPDKVVHAAPPSVPAAGPSGPAKPSEPLAPAARAPEEAKPTPPAPPRGPTLPTVPGSREVRDLPGGGRSSASPRTPRRPSISPLGNRPMPPPPLKTMPPKVVKEEPRQKPIARIDPALFDQNKPIRPEDILKPKTDAATIVEVEEDDDGKGKKANKAIPGRDVRRRERQQRAEKRKEAKVEVDAHGKVVITEDEPVHHKSNRQRKKLKLDTMPRIGKVPLEMPITARSLSEAIGMRSVELLFKLKELGAGMLSINSIVDPALAEVIALDRGCELEIKRPPSVEEKILTTLDKPDQPEELVPRAPVVTIMGHVDHGKTTLLDKIRKSNVAATEAGGITQVIRAWRVEHGGRPVTFLDTPGHEAFTKMRARGAQVTDIAVIVVAADDGVMPQTEEAIQHARAAGVSLVIAINKVDLPSANVERTRRQLYNLNVLPDNMGGDTPFVETSAASGKGIDDLLDQLSVVAELKELKSNPNKPGRGTVLEAMLSEGEGVLATLLVREGTLKKGDILLCGAAYGRVRQMYDDLGKPLDEAGPSIPVRITGLDEVPNADDPFQAIPDLAMAREIASIRKAKQIEATQIKRVPLTLERLADAKIAELKVILKADFRGSIEAIRKELEKLHHEEVRVKVLKDGIGAISEADVWLALTSPDDTMIVGFNAVPDTRARILAEEKGLKIHEYNIIYNLTNDIKAALEGKLKPREDIIHLGRALVRDTFKISRVGTIAGCYVTQGNIRRNAKIRLIREGVVIFPPADRTAGLESLKRFKEDVSEVREGFECGIKIAGYDDVKVGDVIEAYRVEQVQRTLETAGAS
jgi:translation initiation factor IF-2